MPLLDLQPTSSLTVPCKKPEPETPQAKQKNIKQRPKPHVKLHAMCHHNTARKKKDTRFSQNIKGTGRCRESEKSTSS